MWIHLPVELHMNVYLIKRGKHETNWPALEQQGFKRVLIATVRSQLNNSYCKLYEDAVSIGHQLAALYHYFIHQRAAHSVNYCVKNEQLSHSWLNIHGHSSIIVWLPIRQQ